MALLAVLALSTYIAVQMQALEKKRPKEEKEIAQRLKPLAKLQTAEDYDQFVDGILCQFPYTLSGTLRLICGDFAGESILRKRIQELQFYRRMGLRTITDIERYEMDVQKRVRFLRSSISRTCL